MAGETRITLVGNLTSDPELRFTDSGTPVCGLTVACKESRLGDSGKFEDFGEPAFWACSVWRNPLAENVAESLSKGMRVIVTGRVRARTWTDKHEQTRRDLELDVDAIGPELRFQRARVMKPAREGQEAAEQARTRPTPASAAVGGEPPF